MLTEGRILSPRHYSVFLASELQSQQMSKYAVGCHLWMKRGNREKTTRYSGFRGENSRNLGKNELCF